MRTVRIVVSHVLANGLLCFENLVAVFERGEALYTEVWDVKTER
jgi:hypothetical protein